MGRRVVGFSVLYAGTKDGAVPGMQGILGAGRNKVLKYVQGFWNVGRHGYITGAVSVITGKVESTEEVGGPINRNGIELFKGLNQAVGALFVNIFDAKVVDHEPKTDIQCRVLPKGRSTRDRSITKLCEMRNGLVILNADGLFETGHAIYDLELVSFIGAMFHVY